MDWIEQWFGIAPDNGDGTLELLIVVTALSFVLVSVALGRPRIRALLTYLVRSNREERPDGGS